jgi:hypothetical protein
MSSSLVTLVKPLLILFVETPREGITARPLAWTSITVCSKVPFFIAPRHEGLPEILLNLAERARHGGWAPVTVTSHMVMELAVNRSRWQVVVQRAIDGRYRARAVLGEFKAVYRDVVKGVNDSSLVDAPLAAEHALAVLEVTEIASDLTGTGPREIRYEDYPGLALLERIGPTRAFFASQRLVLALTEAHPWQSPRQALEQAIDQLRLDLAGESFVGLSDREQALNRSKSLHPARGRSSSS